MRVVLAAANARFAAPIARALIEQGRLVGVLRPARRLAWARRVLRGPAADLLDGLAADAGVTTVAVRGDDRRIARALERLRPDALLIATFPFILGPEALAVPRIASLNIHTSLLPRHRGPNPLFWLYHRNDDLAGVSIHAVTARVDAGPIFARAALPLPRGRPVTLLMEDLAALTTPLAGAVLDEVGRGRGEPEQQDELLATAAPRVAPDARMVDFTDWGVERVWHFLHGLFPKFREDLRLADGTPVRYRGVGAWRPGPVTVDAGSVSAEGRDWRLWCRDGSVVLKAGPEGVDPTGAPPESGRR